MRETGWQVPYDSWTNLWNFFQAFSYDAMAFFFLCAFTIRLQWIYAIIYLVFGRMGRHYRYRNTVMVNPETVLDPGRAIREFVKLIKNDPRRTRT